MLPVLATAVITQTTRELRTQCIAPNTEATGGYGICETVQDATYRTYIELGFPGYHASRFLPLDEAFKCWPHTTGWNSYPVPGDPAKSPLAAISAFNRGVDCRSLWADTPYGVLRRDLAEHMYKYYGDIMLKYLIPATGMENSFFSLLAYIDMLEFITDNYPMESSATGAVQRHQHKRHYRLDLKHGLCANCADHARRLLAVSGYFDTSHRINLLEYGKRWPGYSGEYAFPVPSDKLKTEEADYTYYATSNKYSNTAYGTQRLYFARYLLQELRAELSQYRELGGVYHAELY